jgi:RimJ/RimL family protein N-acetyltransferase
LNYCFEALATLRVQLKADARNVRSCTAIERLGAKKEGILRKNRIMYDGYVRDTVYFSILQEEWQSVKNKE